MGTRSATASPCTTTRSRSPAPSSRRGARTTTTARVVAACLPSWYEGCFSPSRSMRSIIRYRSGLLSSIFVQVKPSLKKKTFFFLIFKHDEKQKKIFFGETHLNMLKFFLKKKKFYFQRFVQVKPSLKKKKF